MITYIINTSDNKTFSSDELFKLVGYSRIKWIKTTLPDIQKAADEIILDQDVLDAEDFQIAVIIDFHEFDKVRKPYGLEGSYAKEKGVELSVYFPFIESFLIDHLFDYINKKEIHPVRKDIFYLENTETERFNSNLSETDELFDEDLKILTGNENDVETQSVDVDFEIEYEKDLEYKAKVQEEIQALIAKNDLANKRKYEKEEKRIADALEEKKITKAEAIAEMDALYTSNKDGELLQVAKPQKDINRYGSFQLYCSETMTLEFLVNDYPYHDLKRMTPREFARAFDLRNGSQQEVIHTQIHIHHYYSGNHNTETSAAFDVLSLALYLIKTYEKGETIKDIEGKHEVPALDKPSLREALEHSWNKVRAAKLVAQNNSYDYYDVVKIAEQGYIAKEKKDISPEEAIKKCYYEVKKNDLPKDVEDAYKEIIELSATKSGVLEEKQNNKLKDIINNYMKKRDEVRDDSPENLFYHTNLLSDESRIKRCPSMEDFEKAVKNREKDLSEYLSEVYNAGYLAVEYSEEKREANEQKEIYDKYSKLAKKRITLDIVMWVVITLVTMIPFIVFHSISKSFTGLDILNYLLGLAIFTGIYVVVCAIVMIPIMLKINKAKKKIIEICRRCRGKKDYSVSLIKQMYQNQLLVVERSRYEIRRLTFLQKANITNNRRVNEHRNMLDDIENKISSLLTNLRVQPVDDPDVNIEGEFDITKPFRAPENKIYKIFSVDVIETLFEKEGE